MYKRPFYPGDIVAYCGKRSGGDCPRNHCDFFFFYVITGIKSNLQGLPKYTWYEVRLIHEDSKCNTNIVGDHLRRALWTFVGFRQMECIKGNV